MPRLVPYTYVHFDICINDVQRNTTYLYNTKHKSRLKFLSKVQCLKTFLEEMNLNFPNQMHFGY